MVDIFQKNHDLLNDKEIKFAKVGIANVIKNYSFSDIQNIVDEEQNRKQFMKNIKTNPPSSHCYF